MSSIDRYLALIRACSYCGSFWGFTDLLCNYCWSRLQDSMLTDHRQIISGYPFKVYTLFLWNDRQHELIKTLIYALKGGWSYQAFAKLAQDFAWPISSNGNLVPAPPRSPNKYDHASVFAEALGNLYNVPVKHLLKRTDFRPQKTKKQMERAKIEIQSQDHNMDYNHIVFVDDVVTTGATALAAFKALGQPRHFEVYCIVCNPPLAMVASKTTSVL